MKTPFKNYDERYRWFNHFVTQWALGNVKIPMGITGRKINKVANTIMNNDNLWFDILERHDCLYDTPEIMIADKPDVYIHAMSNFWATIRELT